MKKSLLVLALSTMLSTGCFTPSGSGSKKKKSSSIDETTTATVTDTSTGDQSTTITSGPTSNTSGPTTSTSSSTGTSGSSQTSSTSTTSVEPTVVTQTIAQIKSEKKLGELVRFEGTLLRVLTWARSNEDLMYFADAHDTIWVRFAYANYTEHLQKLYHMKEYQVTAKVAETDNGVELVYDSSLTDRQTVVSLGDSYPISYNKETTPVTVSGISEIKAKSKDIVQNNKGYGAGNLVKFTSQIVQTEYTDANKKAMVLDPDGNTITVIGDGKKMVDTGDIGKYYTWVGIISLELSIPAILGIECSYVSHTSEEESSIDVSAATQVSPSSFSSYSLTSSKWNPMAHDNYYKLYKATGYVVDNSDITGSFNYGMVDNYGGSLSDAGSTNTVKGFYIVNCTGLDNDANAYCPVAEYAGQNQSLEVYFAIRGFDTQNHLWKMMVIEGLIPELS